MVPKRDAPSAPDAPARDVPVGVDLPFIADTPGVDRPATPDHPLAQDVPTDRVEPPPCEAWSLGTSPTQLALPSGYPAGAFRNYGRHSSYCTGAAGMPVFTPTDANGDGRLDLLVSSRCGQPESAATWQLHEGGATGFGPARTLAIPGGFPIGTFADVFSGLQCSASPPRPGYLLTDYNADRRPDILMYASCSDAAVGTAHYRLFAGTPNGFAEGVNLQLPSGFDPGTFAALQTPRSCAGGRTQNINMLLDLDGDGLPDLTMFSDCADPEVGSARWRLYRNTRSALGPVERVWTLPSGYGSLAFTNSFSPTLRCPSVPVTYFVTDLDGDRLPDLVVFKTCGDASVGQSHWLVHRNTGARFAQEPTRWTLPSSLPAGAVDIFGNGMDCSARRAVTPSLLDVNGDGRVDLVTTTDCSDPTIGVTHWNVYLNVITGFAATPLRVALPRQFPGAEYRYPSYGITTCGTGVAPWGHALADFDGDRSLDLVFHHGCNDAQLGTSAWWMFRGACR